MLDDFSTISLICALLQMCNLVDLEIMGLLSSLFWLCIYTMVMTLGIAMEIHCQGWFIDDVDSII